MLILVDTLVEKHVYYEQKSTFRVSFSATDMRMSAQKKRISNSDLSFASPPSCS